MHLGPLQMNGAVAVYAVGFKSSAILCALWLGLCCATVKVLKSNGYTRI